MSIDLNRFKKKKLPALLLLFFVVISLVILIKPYGTHTGSLLVSEASQSYQLLPGSINLCNVENSIGNLSFEYLNHTSILCINDSFSSYLLQSPYIELSFSDMFSTTSTFNDYFNLTGSDLILDWHSEVNYDAEIFYLVNESYESVCGFEISQVPTQSICDLSDTIGSASDLKDTTLRIYFTESLSTKNISNLITGKVLEVTDIQDNNLFENVTLNNSSENNTYINNNTLNQTETENITKENQTIENITVDNNITLEYNTTMPDDITQENMTIDNLTIENTTTENITLENIIDNNFSKENITIDTNQTDLDTNMNLIDDATNGGDENLSNNVPILDNMTYNQTYNLTDPKIIDNITTNLTNNTLTDEVSNKDQIIYINNILLNVKYIIYNEITINLTTNGHEYYLGYAVSINVTGDSQIIDHIMLTINKKNYELKDSFNNNWNYIWTVPKDSKGKSIKVTARAYGLNNNILDTVTLKLLKKDPTETAIPETMKEISANLTDVEFSARLIYGNNTAYSDAELSFGCNLTDGTFNYLGKNKTVESGWATFTIDISSVPENCSLYVDYLGNETLHILPSFNSSFETPVIYKLKHLPKNIPVYDSLTGELISLDQYRYLTNTKKINLRLNNINSFIFLDNVSLDAVNTSKTPKIIKDKTLKSKLEKNVNLIVKDFIWLESNGFVPASTGGKIILPSIGDKTFKCDGTLDTPDCFEIQLCDISSKPCYEQNQGTTIVYVNHFSGVLISQADGYWLDLFTDNSGVEGNYNLSINGELVSIDQYWQNYTVDTVSPFDSYFFAQNSTKVPHVAYQKNTGAKLNLAKKPGSSWSYQELDSQALTGRYSSLSFDSNDNPHVAYQYSGGTYDLKYYNGSSSSSSTIDTSSYVTMIDLIMDSNDNPHIVYHANSTGNLTYNYWNGSTWNKSGVTFIDYVPSYQWTSSAISIDLDSNNEPHILFQNASSKIYANGSGGSWSFNTIDASISSSNKIRLDSSDYPHMVYIDNNDNLIYYFYNGTGWENETLVASVGIYSSIRDFVFDSSENIHLTYVNSTASLDEIWYIYYNGTSWVKEFVTSTSDTYFGPTFILLDINENPQILSSGDLSILFSIEKRKYDYGNITSIAITPSSTFTWDIFFANDSVSVAQGTNITYKILNESDNSTLCTITEAEADVGYNISTCASTATSIRLFANMTTTDSAYSPNIYDWNVTWIPIDTTNPNISFVSPTPDADEAINTNYVYINVTVTDDTNTTAFIDWNNSLVGWWRFNNESGENNTFFRDWSTWSNNGTCTSSNCPNYTTGKFGEAMIFDRINDYVSIPDSNSLDLVSNFTIEGWFKPEDTYSNTSDYYQGLLDKGTYQVFLDKSDGKLKLNLDSNDTKSWSALGGGPSWSVYSLIVWNGNLYAGGEFSTAGGQSAHYIAKWNGASWSALGSGMSSYVYSLIVYDDELYASGNFVTAGGVTVNRVAKWNGTTWSALGSGMDSYVFSLAIYNGDLYAGGGFSTADGVSANNIAKWNGTAWSALGSGMDNNVYAFGIYNGDLYVGGSFTTADGLSANRTAKWNGTAWSAVGSGMDNDVRTFGIYNGALYAGGGFSTADGVSANNIAKWNGTTWSALSSEVSNDAYSLVVYNGELYAGGLFNTAGGVTVNRVAKWNGTTWSALGSGISGGNLWGLTFVTYNSELYFGGSFTAVGGVGANNIARLSDGNDNGISSNTNTWSGWNHFSYVHNSTDTTVYINGILETSKSQSINLTKNTLSLYIGKTYGSQMGGVYGGTSSEHFNGTIDEIRIHNRALTSEEINASYNAGIYRLETNLTDLEEGNYTFIAYAQDLAGNINQTETRTLSIPFIISNCTDLNLAGKTYLLESDILNSATSYCMNISANNITLDCRSNTIDSNGLADYGIYINRTSATITNITIKNCDMNDWDTAHIYLEYSNQNNLINITLNSSNNEGIKLLESDSNNLTNIIITNIFTGIYLSNSDSNTFINTSISSSIWSGIRVIYSDSNTFINSTVNSTTLTGIILSNSDFITLDNVTLLNNANDINYYTLRSNLDCNATFTNVIGIDNKPIVFYNTSVNIQDWDNNVSEIILCGTDGLTINNITINHTEGGNKGLQIIATKNSNIMNSRFINQTYGIYYYESDFNNLTNITTTSNEYGIYYQESDSNNLTNITVNYNTKGIYLDFSALNTIIDSKIENNTNAGIELFGSDLGGPNKIYNNLLNNTNNIVFSYTIYANSFNITQQSGTRIDLAGTDIGGNYYTNSTGDGYSDICIDAEKDGFCDSAYNLTTGTTCIPGVDCDINTTDYLPLSNEGPQNVYGCEILSTENKSYILLSNVSSAGTCFTISADNITLDCNGYTINFSQSVTGYGINNTQIYDYITIKNCNIVQGNSTEDSFGIRYLTSNDGLIENNTFIINGSYSDGVYLKNSSNVQILSNNFDIDGYVSDGIYLWSNDTKIQSNNITIRGNNIIGIFIYSSNSNNITQNNLTEVGTLSTNIYLYDSYSNTLQSNTLSSVGVTSTGLTFITSYNNLIIDTIITSTNNDLNIDGTNGYTNYLINTTFDNTKVNFPASVTDKIEVQWYLDVYVNNTIGDLVENVEVNGTMNNSTEAFTNQTDASGNIERQILTEYMQNKTAKYYADYVNYTIDASLNGYINASKEVNLTTNKQIYVSITDIFPLIDFVLPTEDNNSNINYSYTYINVTATDTNNITAFIDWNSSLVGWWRFNNESGENNTHFNDWSNYDNNGTCSGNNCSNYTIGKFGKGMVFDGVDDYIDMGNNPSLSTVNAITVEAWVNAKTNVTQIIVNKLNFTSAYLGWVINLNAAKTFQFIIGNGTSSSVLNPGTPQYSNNIWYHVVGVYNNTDQLLYVDGNQIGSITSINLIDSGTTAQIGKYSDGTSDYFNGTIDEVKIWNRQLTPAEINASYNAGLYRLETNFTNLANGNYTYMAYVQDFSGNINQTETRTLEVDVDLIYPQYSLNSTNSTGAGVSIEHSLKWTDNINLSGYIFSFNNGTNWTFTDFSDDKETGTQSFIGSNTSYIYNETFESAWVNWSNTIGDTDEWTRDYGGTPSGSTGPCNGGGGSNCGALSSDWYVYVETSSSYCNAAGETALLFMTQELNFNSDRTPQISWWNNMYGSEIGTIRLQENTSGTWNDLWTMSGNQSTAWFMNTTDLTGLTGIGYLRFNYTCAGGYWGDMTIDEIIINSTRFDVDENKTATQYSDITTESFEVITNISITVNISYYNTSGSISNTNTNATLWLEVYNGTDWVDEGSFETDSTDNFTIIVTTPSVLSNWQTQSNRKINISAKYIDYVSSSIYDTINYTDVWVEVGYEQEFLNDTWTQFPQAPINESWSNVTKTVNSTIEATIKWKVYANDTNNNYNVSEIYTYTTIDTTPPTIDFIVPTTETGSYTQAWISANVTATDSIGLGTINITLYNSTGDLINSINSTSSPLYYNFTGLSDGIYYLNASANDTAGNTNNTETRTITIDTTPPTITIQSPTATTYGTVNIDLNYSAQDTNGISICIYELNGANTTISSCANTTIIATEGANNLKMYANDTSDNWNMEEVDFTVSLISLQITKLLNPDILVAGENETISVNTTVKINQTQNDVYSINVTDEIPYDFYNTTEITVYFRNATTAELTELTTGLTVTIVDLAENNNTQVQVNITNISETNLAGYIKENDSIILTYDIYSSQLNSGETRTMYINASVMDINENQKTDYTTKNISASTAVLRGSKYIYINPANPQKITVTIVVDAIGDSGLSEIILSDFLPIGATINNKTITYYNNSNSQTYSLYNDTDYSLENPSQDNLPGGESVDVYNYNFTYNYTNWSGTLFDNDSITIVYNATIIGGGSWLLPTILGGYDPIYKTHIRTEMYTDMSIPLFDIILNIITRTITLGEPVTAILTMENVGGPKAKVDVMINYAIKTQDGKHITGSTDTIAVIDKKEKMLNLYLPRSVGEGVYTFEAFVTYTGREAMSTRDFEVINDSEATERNDLKSIIIALIIILFMVSILWVQRYTIKNKNVKSRNNNMKHFYNK